MFVRFSFVKRENLKNDILKFNINYIKFSYSKISEMNYLPKINDILTPGVENNNELWKPIAEKFIEYIFKVRDNSIPQIVEISDYSLESTNASFLIQKAKLSSEGQDPSDGNDGNTNTFNLLPNEVDWESIDVTIWPDNKSYTLTLSSKKVVMEMKEDTSGLIYSKKSKMKKEEKIFNISFWSKKDSSEETPEDNVIYYLSNPGIPDRHQTRFYYQMRNEDGEWKIYTEGSFTKSSK